MVCRQIDLGGGASAIVCSRGQRAPQCSTKGCRNTATRLCDFPLQGKRAGQTCSAQLCESCAQVQADGTDYCPAHARGARLGHVGPRSLAPEPAAPSSQAGQRRLERLREMLQHMAGHQGWQAKARRSALGWAVELLTAKLDTSQPCFKCGRWHGDIEAQRLDELEAELEQLRAVIREGLGHVADEQLVAALVAQAEASRRIAELEAKVAAQLELGGGL
ncbi:MAG: hypothetical protein KC457_00990 [Myxococcales bacterium]|nr:hypothetical protein [Myxococcales bacterium]